MVARGVLICAAEASGDRLGALLAIELAARGVETFGVVGPAMRTAGVVPIARAEDATALGLVEVFSSLPKILGVLRSVERALDARPLGVVGIDAPGLMARVGAAARRRAIPTVQWVAPQVWAWRSGRAARITRWADEVLCLFPFEPMWLRPYGVRASFVGHPLATVWRSPRAETPTVALLPGSRPAEIRRHWPAIVATAREIRRRIPSVHFRIGVAPTVHPEALAGLDAERVSGTARAVTGAHAAVVCSGTASLEVAAAGVPQVVVYQVNPVTWAIGRRLVRLPALSLPNLLAGATVMPEHLQRLDPRAIADDVVTLCGPAGEAQVTCLAPHLAVLDPAGAVDRVADRVLFHAR